MGGNLRKFWHNLMQALPTLQSDDSPALTLATQLYDMHQQGTHILTLQATEAIYGLPMWVEQLIAESTGKKELGFLPLIQQHGQTPPAESYVHAFGFADELDEDMRVHSVSVFDEISDLAPEFFMWQMTTALLGAMMRINPFDQPHVNATKENTISYLNNTNADHTIAQKLAETSCSTKEIQDFINTLEKASTVCILSYLPHTEASENILQQLQNQLQETTAQISINIGPRYLHSTGQFHKGGADIATYIMLTQNQPAPTVPKENYNFNTLKLAQALGDYEALIHAGRTVYLLHTS